MVLSFKGYLIGGLLSEIMNAQPWHKIRKLLLVELRFLWPMKGPVISVFCFYIMLIGWLSFYKKFYLLILERERNGKREREKH